MTTKTRNHIRSGFCNPSWSPDTEQGKKSHARCEKHDCPCTCGLGIHAEMATHVPAPPDEAIEAIAPIELTGLTVVYTRHGDEEYEPGWHCREDAERFARWLQDCGAAIDVEVVEL